MNRLVPITFLFLLVLVAAGVIGLASSHLSPPLEKVERTIPDDHIPR